MSRPRREHSIEFEPHLQDRLPECDPSELIAEGRIARDEQRSTDRDRVEHSVWDEPALHTELSGEAPEGQITYRRWVEGKIADTSWTTTWLVTLGLILCAGPWGVIGAFFSGAMNDASAVGLVAATIFAPVTEEITKVAAILWVVEKRPYLFKSMVQILLCAAAGGLLFAVIENLLYLNVYIPNASTTLANWRWTVCVGLHVNCSFLAGVGLVRIWDNAVRNRQRPQLGLGMPWIFTAMVGHGLYNFGVSIAEMIGWLELD